MVYRFIILAVFITAISAANVCNQLCNQQKDSIEAKVIAACNCPGLADIQTGDRLIIINSGGLPLGKTPGAAKVPVPNCNQPDGSTDPIVPPTPSLKTLDALLSGSRYGFHDGSCGVWKFFPLPTTGTGPGPCTCVNGLCSVAPGTGTGSGTGSDTGAGTEVVIGECTCINGLCSVASGTGTGTITGTLTETFTGAVSGTCVCEKGLCSLLAISPVQPPKCPVNPQIPSPVAAIVNGVCGTWTFAPTECNFAHRLLQQGT